MDTSNPTPAAHTPTTWHPRRRPRGPVAKTVRALGFTLLGLTTLAAAYVAGPALWRAKESQQVFGTPFVQELMAQTGLDPDKVKMGASASAFTVQALASWVSLFSGFAIDTSIGSDWYVSDTMHEAAAQPAQGRFMLLASSCLQGAQQTSFMVTQGAGSGSIDQAMELMADTSSGFKPKMPWLVRENLSIQETRAAGKAPQVQLAAASRPAPLWKLPRLGPFQDTPARRAEVVKLNPVLDQMHCEPNPQTGVDLAQSLASLRSLGVPAAQLSGLLQWAKAPSASPAGLPTAVYLRLPTVGVLAFAPTVTATEDGQLQLQLRSVVKQSLSWDNLRDAAPLTRFEGPVIRTVQMHKDGNRFTQAQEIQLKDARLSASAALEAETLTVALAWKTPARR